MNTHLKQPIVLTILYCLLIASLFGCGSNQGKELDPPPTIMNPQYRPAIVLDVEIDTPPLYNLGHEAALAVANKIDDLTRENTGGAQVFVCFISSQSFEDCSSINFTIPPIPAFTLPPNVPRCDIDPYACSKLKQTYAKAFASWQVIHTSQQNSLARVRAWVHKQTDKIRALTFRYDDKGSDIPGGLATASQNLQGVKATKYLILATDFVSTTTMQDVGSLSLQGVHVEAIFRTCPNQDNKTCQQNNSYWSSVVRGAGALSFNVYSVAQSEVSMLQLSV